MIPRTFLLLLALPVLLLAGLLVACGQTEEVPIATLATLETSTPTPLASSPTPGTGLGTAQPTATPAQPTVAAIPADWKSYTDPFYGFSLKYPPDLKFKDVTMPGRPDGLDERVVEFRSPTDPKRAFGVSISSNPKKLTPQEWALEFTACLPKTIQQGSVAGRTALLCTEEAIEGKPGVGIAFDHMGSIFHVSSGWGLPPSEFELVIASFEVGP